mmetsp:Transcript_36150/g.41701  ORF Transcript_36150/g.41701 Transcript_36150/m.41701 type:complete len:108 (-) Transcript_36150:743-1066(-)
MINFHSSANGLSPKIAKILKTKFKIQESTVNKFNSKRASDCRSTDFKLSFSAKSYGSPSQLTAYKSPKNKLALVSNQPKQAEFRYYRPGKIEQEWARAVRERAKEEK